MKNKFLKLFKLLFYLIILELFIINKSSESFFPIINEPNQQELEATSLQIGRTAIQLIEFNQNIEAIKLLKLAVKLNPNQKDLWLSLGEAQRRANRAIKALSSLNKALVLSPKEQEIYFVKASIYMDLNNPKKAKDYIIEGLSINRNNEKGYFQLGNAEIMLKNYKSALIAFDKSSKLNSKFWQSLNNQGLVLYELDKKKEAISKFKSALEISNDAEPMLALATVLYSTDNKSIDSLNLAKKALISNPKYVSKIYQSKQLWGKKLQKSAHLLFQNDKMKKSVKEALEKSQ